MAISDRIDSIWLTQKWRLQSLFSFLTCKFDYFRSHFSIFEYRILYHTCFAKFPRIQKYRIYSGLNLNMKKKQFCLSRKWKFRKKILLHCLTIHNVFEHYKLPLWLMIETGWSENAEITICKVGRRSSTLF